MSYANSFLTVVPTLTLSTLCKIFSISLLTLSALLTTRDTCVNSIDPDETVRNEPSHQDIHCLPPFFSESRLQSIFLGRLSPLITFFRQKLTTVFLDSGRERITVKYFMINPHERLLKDCCRTPQPPDHQSNVLPTEPPRPATQ